MKVLISIAITTILLIIVSFTIFGFISFIQHVLKLFFWFSSLRMRQHLLNCSYLYHSSSFVISGLIPPWIHQLSLFVLAHLPIIYFYYSSILP